MPDLLISVVIPAYNYAQTLARAAVSVIDQLDGQCELIIIDDGSTDTTPQVVASLQSNYPGRFRAIHKVNGGLASVRNLGIDEARGSYLVFLDADDEMVIDALKNLRQCIQQNPAARLIIGGHYSVREDGRETLSLPGPLPGTAAARVKAYLLDKTLGIANGACAMHREVFNTGRYPQAFRNAEDIPVFAQVFARYDCVVVNAALARIYKHNDSLRHNLEYDIEVGVGLVDEVFESGRLPDSMKIFKRAFTAQRYLSLFRAQDAAGHGVRAKEFYRQAIRIDWRAVFRWSYTRKALRLWLK